eukprot:866052-Prymnesium_polylepis.1
MPANGPVSDSTSNVSSPETVPSKARPLAVTSIATPSVPPHGQSRSGRSKATRSSGCAVADDARHAGGRVMLE